MFEILPMNHTKNHYNNYNPLTSEDDFSRSLFGALSPFFGSSATELFSTDIRKDGDNFIMETDLPGFSKDDISIDIDGDYLTVKAVRHSLHEDKEEKKNFIRCERSYGAYQRSFDISGVDSANISAKFDNGVLTLTLPSKKPLEPSTRKLTIE